MIESNNADIFEVSLTDTYHYRLSYGGQSPYFRGLERGQLVASVCGGCGHVWLPLRPVCSKCYALAAPKVLSGMGTILISIELPDCPEHLKFLKASVSSSLVLPDGADTCIKALVVSRERQFSKGTRVRAEFLPEIQTIADFYFVPDATR